MYSEKAEDQHRTNNVSSIDIAFLTDGQDGSGSRDTLVSDLKDILKSKWEDGPIRVHTLGFSNCCDQNLLESIREAGTIPGIYQFAEPADDGDTLCNKLTSIFEYSSKASTVPITLHINGTPEEVRFPIDSHKRGTVLIIKSKTGRFVSGISQFPADNEVIFLSQSSWLPIGTTEM